MSWIGKIAVDVRPLRDSRDLRLLTVGSLITGLGSQATLVALPYQVYVITESAFVTGLLFAAVAAGSTVAALTTGWLVRARSWRSRPS